MKSLLIISFILLLGLNGYGQNNDDCEMLTEIKGNRCYFTGGLFNNNESILVAQVGCLDEQTRSSNYVIIDLINCRIISEFKVKPWSYLGRSFFYQDSLVYIMIRAEVFSVYSVYSINSGKLLRKVKHRDSPMKEKRAFSSGKNEVCYDNNNLKDDKILLESLVLEVDSLNKIIVKPK